MSERSVQALLLRRAAFGPAAGELDQRDRATTPALIDALADPDAHGVAPAPDPWAAFDGDGARARTGGGQMVAAWLQAMATTPRPLEEWMRWFWHGHFVSTFAAVKRPALMIGQLRLFGRLGLGDFRSLLAAVTTDPAMLLYLDGARSTRAEINENYGREVLELFSLGLGRYGEADVRAGAVALTGWTVPGGTRTGTEARFAPRRHDDSPQHYLGRDGVHDVDTVVDAIVAHPACAPFITGKLARAVLGPDVDAGLVESLARDFARSDLALRPLVRALLDAAGDGHARPLVRAPVPWLVAMIKATGADPARAAGATGKLLKAAGQVPLAAPNVGGWPGGPAWLASGATVARWNQAVALAAIAPIEGRARATAAAGDWDALADALGRPDGFGSATRAGLDRARPLDRHGESALALAMASAEVVMA